MRPVPHTRAVFLDRDGTVVHDRGYADSADAMELLPGAGEALAALRDADFALVLITNQAGVGRGYFSEEVVHAQHQRIAELLATHGVAFDAIEYCPHHPDDGCDCRKPRPGMIERAARRLGIDVRRSFMVGDKVSDVEAGRAAGCISVLVGSGCPSADAECASLAEAGRWILQNTETEHGS